MGELNISGTENMVDWDYMDTEDWHSFENRIKVKKVVIGEGVISIGKQAFWGCKNLTNIEIPNSVVTIGGNAFYKCTSLTSVKLPKELLSLGDYAFAWCTSLTNIEVSEENTVYMDDDSVLKKII